ncbi:glycosyltransferase family 2 protein [Glaciimonas sp. Gout2]|uniref:glycosyltransferase family 2 protein n=1 Tax=unclassified Glaciimonas TaxID=2644401 RepID=UPI002AB3E53C|nr:MULTISPECIES: glycosyltransferase family 2 protein [unclassified Glaciimonas]MDY7548582.1 glycosyltransferase family 2 protein [Glaciimonas sp. CA11.2]MEB0013769.1 glycosyltransferase family 2 protein [Glaciimonas sp. Cout2]MEB0084511.1 glycosyltransferase family 2 protein [Glaciimonas sp. Gout2]
MNETACEFNEHLNESIFTLQRIAVLIPCYNEEVAVASVVQDFRLALPTAEIFVFDNNSTDRTMDVAKLSGATVRSVPLQGKGNVVRRMFADVDADVYVMVDGDNTYDATVAPRLINKLLTEGLDMVVGVRVTKEQKAYRFGHRLGNAVLTRFVAFLFGRTFTDMLSGYRVFSRRYVKSFPAQSRGFETETELAIHALQLRMPVAELNTTYGSRVQGSSSKLNTYRDGFRILVTIVRLFKSEKPLTFFSFGFFFCTLIAILLALPLFETYYETGLVPRYPTAVLCSALMLFGVILLTCGIVLNTVTKGRTEAKRFAYLVHPAPATKNPN